MVKPRDLQQMVKSRVTPSIYSKWSSQRIYSKWSRVTPWIYSKWSSQGIDRKCSSQGIHSKWSSQVSRHGSTANGQAKSHAMDPQELVTASQSRIYSKATITKGIYKKRSRQQLRQRSTVHGHVRGSTGNGQSKGSTRHGQGNSHARDLHELVTATVMQGLSLIHISEPTRPP